MTHPVYINKVKGILVVLLLLVQMSAQAQVVRETKRQAVDLGLSVKWANMNLGAESNEDYGKYYAWGETQEKRNYGLRFPYKHYRVVNSAIYYKKYNSKQYKGSVLDLLKELESSDDAATKSWGKKWRIPTQAEINELVNMCTWEIILEEGFHGYRVTGPSGNSIILPFGGYRNENIRFHAGTEGHYWSKTADLSESRNAYSLYIKQAVSAVDFQNGKFNTQLRGIESMNSEERSYGLMIRPVQD